MISLRPHKPTAIVAFRLAARWSSRPSRRQGTASTMNRLAATCVSEELSEFTRRRLLGLDRPKSHTMKSKPGQDDQEISSPKREGRHRCHLALNVTMAE